MKESTLENTTNFPMKNTSYIEENSGDGPNDTDLNERDDQVGIDQSPRLRNSTKVKHETTTRVDVVGVRGM